MGHIILVRADAVNGTAGDLALQARLEAAGHTVTRVADDDAEFGGSYDGVVISDSCSGGTVGSKYDTVAKPGITLENVTWRLGTYLSGITGTDWTIENVDGNGGLTGTQTIYSEPVSQQGVDTDTLPGAATVVARLTGDADHGVYVTYEAGGALTSGTAPARRVFLRIGDAAVPVLTAAGTALLDAAIEWAFGPVTETHRFYLANQPADRVPGIATAFLNDTTEAANTRQLLEVPTGVADSVTVTETSDSTSWWMLLGQWITHPATAAGTLTIDYDAVIAFSESTGAADFDPGLNVYVLQGDTTTELGTAVSRVYGQYEFATTPTGIDLTPTGTVDWGDPVDFAAGDRIVVEVFARALTSATTPYGATVHIGGTSGTDLAGDDTDMSRPGWVDLKITPGVTFEPTAATVTGTAAVSLGALSVTASGTVVPEVVTGTAAVSLGALAVTSAGTRTTAGTVAVALGGLDVDAVGTVTAEVVTGAASVALVGLSVAASGVRTVHGTTGAPLGALTLTAVGEGIAPVVTGTAEFVLGGLEVTATGTRIVTGAAAVALGALELEATGTSTSTSEAVRAVPGPVADLSELSPPVLDGPRAPALVSPGSSDRPLGGPQAPLLVSQGSSTRALRGPRVPALSAP